MHNGRQFAGHAAANHQPIRRQRRGITLYEVVLALAIFVSALLVLGQSITTGTRAAVQSRLRTQAIVRCESKLAEVIAGIEPMQMAGNVPFVDDPTHWHWSLDIADGPYPGLLELMVSVSYSGDVAVGFSLNRYVRNPQMFLEEPIDDSSDSTESGE
jgi:general secretion pathway protein I